MGSAAPKKKNHRSCSRHPVSHCAESQHHRMRTSPWCCWRASCRMLQGQSFEHECPWPRHQIVAVGMLPSCPICPAKMKDARHVGAESIEVLHALRALRQTCFKHLVGQTIPVVKTLLQHLLQTILGGCILTLCFSANGQCPPHPPLLQRSVRPREQPHIGPCST